MKLNLGCGRNILSGFVNMDIVPLPGVDVLHDILAFPYPFESGSAELVLASHVFEHLPHQINGRDALLQVVEELHRILAPGGVLEVRGPHPNLGIYYFNNPTHYRVITEWTFDALVGGEHESCVAFWSGVRFKKLTWSEDRWVARDNAVCRLVLRQFYLHEEPLLRRLVARPTELVIRLEK